jgi:hypothetical protein
MAANNNPTTEVLAGLVERVTFHNEDNGFCVLRVKARGKREPITVVGHAAVISAGEFIQASGERNSDRATVPETDAAQGGGANLSWLRQFDDIILGHGVSLLGWRGEGVEHPHDTPPFPRAVTNLRA